LPVSERRGVVSILSEARPTTTTLLFRNSVVPYP
jgi:hypothetical protein